MVQRLPTERLAAILLSALTSLHMVAGVAQAQRLAPAAAEAVAAAAQQWAAVQHLPLERLAGLHLFLAQPQQHMQLTSAAGEVQPLMPDQAISAVAVVAPALQR